ncbi:MULTISPECIES: NlpC/P60 family protein [unclassified Dietzia]|uniref:NlpC/P60 family protein n=2 Tax=Dietzia TaxID=37914 RepID=UPI000D20549C|nr:MULTISPECIES: NlpC/P60 family protein [unclassified Dietzia]AVZ41112.1 NlpC/P60 family protein [Dietzia sp. JS16-p6b]
MTQRSRSIALTVAAFALLGSGGVMVPAQTVSAQTVDPGTAGPAGAESTGTTGPPQDTAPERSASSGQATGEDLVELARLSAEAGALGEELHLARADLERADAERQRREREAGVAAGLAAVADLGASRDQSLVDRLATLRYRGGDTGATRAAVLAESPRDLVDRIGTLQRLSGATTSALGASRAASAEAARLRVEADLASEAARASARDAQRRADDLDQRSDEMRVRIDEVRRRVDALSDAQRALWAGGPLVPPGYVAPAIDGVNTAALNVALTRIGAPYSWGATGPSEFDCSGLMVWAYAQEGKTLPRSSQAQAVAGAPVAMPDIQPGDLVIYYAGATHVGMYAGDGLVLHAPTYGVPVKLEKVDAMPISGVRRY